MTTPRVRLRPAAAGDSKFLLDLRNDPEVRQQSINSATVEPDEHQRWLAVTLADAARNLYVIEVDGQPVGQLRLDSDSTGSAEVSLSLVAAARGAGTAPRALHAARAEAARLGIHTLRAVVKAGNAASLAAFRRAGYELRHAEGDLLELTASVGGGA